MERDKMQEWFGMPGNIPFRDASSGELKKDAPFFGKACMVLQKRARPFKKQPATCLSKHSKVF